MKITEINENQKFNLEMQLLYLDIGSMKESLTYNIIRGIGQSRISPYLLFSGYGNLSFDPEDKKHRYPIVTKLDNYTKRKTNCLIYDLGYNTYNNGQYDKLFIYISCSKKESYFGYIFHNTKTGKCSNKFLIPNLIDELIISINSFFYTLLNKVIIDFYLKKNQDLSLYLHGKKKINTYGTLSDYKKMLEEYQNRLYIETSIPEMKMDDL